MWAVGIALFVSSFLLLHSVSAATQKAVDAEYRALFESGSYGKAMEVIEKRLDAYYSTRVDNRRIPLGFITMKAASKKEDLKTLFRNRKAEGFFIEENPEISELHLFAGRCEFKLSRLDHSLNHYIQALRYKKVELKKDDIIHYEIAQVYKRGGYFNAYVNSLEKAGSLNPDNYSYSLELGKALYRTAMKKRAIHHLARYINGTDEAVAPELYLMLGNLQEDIGQFLETEKNYLKYLEKKPDDGRTQFALGHLAYQRTGNYTLAVQSLDKALRLLAEDEIYRRSKIYEYKADMVLSELDFENAARYYLETIRYQDKVAEDIKNRKSEIAGLSTTIRNLKASLLKEENFTKYNEYESLLDVRGKKEFQLKQAESEYNKLNAGKVRWNLAYVLERMDRLDEAVQYYRQTISFDYNPDQARKKIINLELKIKRGY